MDPYADKGDWTLDGLKKLMGAIFPEAVRQARAERDRQCQRLQEAYHAYVLGWDMGGPEGDRPVFVHQRPDGYSLSWEAPSPLPAWRTRTPAEVAEYDRRFLHVLGIEAL